MNFSHATKFFIKFIQCKILFICFGDNFDTNPNTIQLCEVCIFNYK